MKLAKDRNAFLLVYDRVGTNTSHEGDSKEEDTNPVMEKRKEAHRQVSKRFPDLHNFIMQRNALELRKRFATTPVSARFPWHAAFVPLMLRGC